jgi:hypothetical protein
MYSMQRLFRERQYYGITRYYGDTLLNLRNSVLALMMEAQSKILGRQ